MVSQWLTFLDYGQNWWVPLSIKENLWVTRNTETPVDKTTVFFLSPPFSFRVTWFIWFTPRYKLELSKVNHSQFVSHFSKWNNTFQERFEYPKSVTTTPTTRVNLDSLDYNVSALFITYSLKIYIYSIIFYLLC